MNQLVLRDKVQEYLFRFLGVLTLLSVGLQLFIQSPKTAIFWMLAVVFILVAIFFLTLNFGALINRITADRGILTIRWNTKILKKRLPIDQIAEITEDERYIRITMKDGSNIRLHVKHMDADKRRAARKFLKRTRDCRICCIVYSEPHPAGRQLTLPPDDFFDFRKTISLHHPVHRISYLYNNKPYCHETACTQELTLCTDIPLAGDRLPDHGYHNNHYR